MNENLNDIIDHSDFLTGEGGVGGICTCVIHWFFLQLVRTQVLNDENISVVPYDPISGNLILFHARDAGGFGCKVQKFWEP